MATVHPKFVFARTYGTLALVITKENIGKSLGGLYGSKIKLDTSTAKKGGKRAIAVTVLRYVNQQWRIMLHHCSPFRAINPPPSVEKKVTSAKNVLQNLLRGEKGKKKGEKGAGSKKKEDSKVMATGITPKQEEMLKMIEGRDILFGAKEPVKTRALSLNGIDAEASVNRQTIQALRHLVSSGQLSKEEKYALLYSMVESAAAKKESLVETSFKLIYGQRVASEMLNQQVVSAALQDFADQCALTAKQLQRAGKV
ncbi:hypothetical protein EON65_34450 [archaeon]|nr:MAG: hypothetical protein EON65_34450 [archaeon]